MKSVKCVRPELDGCVFGKLTVIRFAGIIKTHSAWECKCECGNTTIVQARKLKNGMTKSCGCIRSKMMSIRSAKHGFTKRGSRMFEYNSWCAMRARCYSSSHVAFKHYGGRGITVCDRWRNDYSAFIADMGERPTNRHTLDRIDVNGNYEPSNCRWATWKEQAANKRSKQ